MKNSLFLKMCIVLFIFTLGVVTNVQPVKAQEGELAPSKITLTGEIIDNYVNASYEYVFDNTNSETATEISWFIGLQNELRLSNISIETANHTFWGHVLPIAQAVKEYNESVMENKTAALVLRTYGGYEVRFNIANNSIVTLTVFVEGLLTRRLGSYTLQLPISGLQIIKADLEVKFTVRCTYEEIIGYAIRGLSSFGVTSISDGIILSYNAVDSYLPQELAIVYALTTAGGGSKLLTYTNGTDNFFVYLLAPVVTDVSKCIQREYVFVIDVSGSMSGGKLEQAKEAFVSIVEDLTSDDLFNIIAFSVEIRALWNEPHSGTPENIQAAKNWVVALTPESSTNFYGACQKGLSMLSAGENVKVMLVLSDGLPTYGEYQQRDEILSHLKEENALNVSISTIAFGSDADDTLMARLASGNNGFFTYVEPGENAVSEILDFYHQMATPIASEFSVFINGATEVNTLSPLAGTPFFNGSEIIITGRYGTSLTLNTTVAFATGTVTCNDAARSPTTDLPHLERIWAQHRISYLLQLIVEKRGSISELENEIIMLSLHYGIIVDGYTGLVLTTDIGEAADNSWQISYTGLPATAPVPPGAAPHPVPGVFLSSTEMLTIGAIGTVGTIIVIIVLLIKKRTE